jgi:DNA-binding HxlR family transcriptional regulator
MVTRKNRRTNHCHYGCAVEAALDVIGDKWKGVILFHLLDKPKRFNEIRKLIPSVTQRMLTLQLRELEQDGVIHREIYPQIPPKVEYSMTELGKTLQPILLALRLWGKKIMEKESQLGQDQGNSTASAGIELLNS